MRHGTEPGRRNAEAKFRRGDLVRCELKKYETLQIIKVRKGEDGQWEYKVRWYNSLALFTGDWVAEGTLSRWP